MPLPFLETEVNCEYEWKKGTFRECVMKYRIYIYAFFRENVPSVLYVSSRTLKISGVF